MSVAWGRGLWRIWIVLAVLWVAWVAYYGNLNWESESSLYFSLKFNESTSHTLEEARADMLAIDSYVFLHFAFLAIWPPTALVAIAYVVRWMARGFRSPGPPK